MIEHLRWSRAAVIIPCRRVRAQQPDPLCGLLLHGSLSHVCMHHKRMTGKLSSTNTCLTSLMTYHCLWSVCLLSCLGGIWLCGVIPPYSCLWRGGVLCGWGVWMTCCIHFCVRSPSTT
jgi:hypothetical protein